MRKAEISLGKVKLKEEWEQEPENLFESGSTRQRAALEKLCLFWG